MAITRYNLYDSESPANCDALCLAFLREALIPDWLGENGTVETDETDDSWYVLTDSDGNTIAKLHNYAGAEGTSYTDPTLFYVDSTHTVGFSNYQYSRYKTGYKTSKGAMIIIDRSGQSIGIGAGILIFGKTNNGKLAMVLKDPTLYYSGTGGYPGYAATAYGAVTGARDDDISALTHGLTFGPNANTYGSSESSGENQTVLCPTPTHSNPGETSIIEGVFMMPWAQYRNEGEIKIGDKYYATNGYWALED